MDDSELGLVISACRAAYSGGGLKADGDPQLNWHRFANLVERHRVQALAWHGLEKWRDRLPSDVRDRLQQSARNATSRSMAMALECGGLRDEFASADIDLLFVKGVVLGALAYPNPFLKMSLDIDLLVADTQLVKAASVLANCGYRPVIPESAETDQITRWHSTHKESVWRRSDGAMQIDLHTRLADHPGLIPNVGLGSPRQTVDIGSGIDLPTLDLDPLFSYLCVHGASSCWFRLKWTCDLVALLQHQTEDEIERLYDVSQQLGSGRTAAQALLVADAVFGISLSTALREKLLADPRNRWLAGMAVAEISQEREPLERRLGTSAIHLSQLILAPGIGNLFAELRRQARSVAKGTMM